MSQRDVRNRIGSVQNIRKITRAMEMVAAARLRRAEQRIQALRPYAEGIRQMTRQAAEAAGNVSGIPVLAEHESESKVALLLVTGDRGLAGAFNSQIIRAGVRAAAAYEGDGKDVSFFASGRRGVSSLTFRGREPREGFVGFSDRPAYADARNIAEKLMAAYADGEIDRVEILYNGYVSALTQEVRHETLLPLQHASVMGEDEDEDDEAEQEADVKRDKRALVEYEPSPEEILQRLVPDYVEISVYRALLESTASEHGARMTAMRNASENAAEIIDDLTLEMNRARQAEITQEIMEVVAGAEALS
jgi:F-type H+-transporting ATPase subunit gamma